MNRKSSLELLKDSINQIKLASRQLYIAFDICKKIDLDAPINDENLMDLEALTARFGRVVDMLTCKLLRCIDLCELIHDGSLIDVMNRAEKRGLIKSALDLRLMKELRNDVVHEYHIQSLSKLHQSIFQSVPKLLLMVNSSVNYAEDLIKKLNDI